MIGVATYQHLRAQAVVTDVCQWIYPQVIPSERKPPAITYSVDQDTRLRLTSGQGSYSEALVSLDVYTNEYADSHEIADAIELAMIDYAGALGTVTPSIEADHIRLERRIDIFEPQSELHRVSMQFFIGYEIG